MIMALRVSQRFDVHVALRPLRQCTPWRGGGPAIDGAASLERVERGSHLAQIGDQNILGGKDPVARARTFQEMPDRLVQKRIELPAHAVSRRHRATLRLRERQFVCEAPLVHPVRVVGDDRPTSPVAAALPRPR